MGTDAEPEGNLPLGLAGLGGTLATLGGLPHAGDGAFK